MLVAILLSCGDGYVGQVKGDGLSGDTCACPDGEDKDGDGQTDDDGGDCDDENAAVYLGADEICDDGFDNDCDGDVDHADLEDCCLDPFVDADGDGWAPTCDPTHQDDCDDTNPSVNPAAVEICDNGIDDNCDGHLDMDDLNCRF